MTTTNAISPAGLAEQEAELHDELIAATDRVLRSGWYVLGPEVDAFEREFSEWCGARRTIGVASGTEALQLALAALGIGDGDEVIIPSNALPTAYGVAASGARVRFADCRVDDYNIDPEDVKDLVNERTRAVVAVHLYGHPAALDELRAVVGPEVAIIEDCAQAHGARIGASSVGTLGDIAAWSFYPTKNLGAYGDGGAVTTNDDALADKVAALRMYGEERRYYSTSLGINSRLDELQAALLRVKLTRLDQWIERRQEIAARYDSALPDWVMRPPLRDGMAHGRHLYPVLVEDRDRRLQELVDVGVPAGVHYPVGAHDQPCFAAIRDRDLPVTQQLSERLLSLPMHPFVSDEDVDRIVEGIAAT